MPKVGDRVKIKTFEKGQESIAWDKRFNLNPQKSPSFRQGQFTGVEGVITRQSGGQWDIDFGRSLKPDGAMPETWTHGKFWENEFDVLVSA